MLLATGEDLVAAIIEFREDEVPGIVRALLESGTEPQAIVGYCRAAMSQMGRRFEEGQAFIPELIMAGEMMKGVSATLRPLLAGSGGQQRLGTVVLGTVKGDIHDIGKDIVATILEAGGFEVIDLGVDVAPERFVSAVGEHPGCTVGLSSLLTTGFDSMKATVEALAAAALREHAKVMLGGASVTDQVCSYAGADAFGTDAATALELAKGWAELGAPIEQQEGGGR